MSDAITRGVRVRVSPTFHPDRTDPDRGVWFFSYTVVISNEGHQAVQLVSRLWRITDANGEEREVRGPGVVGEQPVLEPGESFQYTSFCPLPTSLGSMYGTYQMLAFDGSRFDAEIAPFVLVDPSTVN